MLSEEEMAAARALFEEYARSLDIDLESLYRTLGFAEIPPYRHNPIAGASFLELELRRPRISP